ncbi:type II toxin-antitoxin system prevent-host-death family antitoxin [Chelativorans sp. ZYF759]|uniref:type II toxin-antitoxin system Phd/YefM family antitoxin n=1 Tax=Chelativorans sp. ZYF759 TaxID=2692213 RepID=UPI00145D7FDC|nr:type II toxin-antitoxin system prevent-host-death family antitoxin [Chelativorans sp. ZYF759]NMG38633.1 type II toxin-antitoxin system prevent-host-death family antitoxin [Chelativorans sp. ZYF759]
MAIINMHDAKTRLSDLVARAEAGEEIVIARRNKPAVRLVPVDSGVIMGGSPPGGFAEDSQAEYDVGAMRAAVKAGREFLIMQDGKPVAKLVPTEEKRIRGFGMLAHLPPVPDAFFDPLSEEELRAWEGDEAVDPGRDKT